MKRARLRIAGERFIGLECGPTGEMGGETTNGAGRSKMGSEGRSGACGRERGEMGDEEGAAGGRNGDEFVVPSWASDRRGRLDDDDAGWQKGKVVPMGESGRGRLRGLRVRAGGAGKLGGVSRKNEVERMGVTGAASAAAIARAVAREGSGQETRELQVVQRRGVRGKERCDEEVKATWVSFDASHFLRDCLARTCSGVSECRAVGDKEPMQAQRAATASGRR